MARVLFNSYIMKRFLSLTSVLLLSFFAFGDNPPPKESKTRYYRHEVNVSVGGIGVRSGWSDDYERNVMNRFGLVVGKAGGGSGTGPTGIIYESKDGPDLCRNSPLMTASYYYHFNHYIAVGGIFSFCRVRDWLGYPKVYNKEEIQKTGYTYVKGVSFFMMPSMKWSWLNNRCCSLYMKATAGFHYQSLYLDSETIPKEQTNEFDKSHLNFGYYVTLFGWEIGRQKVRWFTEFGLGSHTNFQMGLTYRFGRY